MKFINNTLSLTDNKGKHIQLTEEDLNAAHPLPVKRGQSMIIVQFHSRDKRDLLMENRRKLKGKPVSISDDLTLLNQQLLSRLHASQNVESAWSWKSKILAKVNGTITQFEPYDPQP